MKEPRASMAHHQFRAPDELVGAAHAAARRYGMTLSAFIRDAMQNACREAGTWPPSRRDGSSATHGV